MSDVSDRERFDFEREKWRADLEMRTREVSVKERDQARSFNPLMVAILAAAAAASGNAFVAWLNGRQQVALEESKAESARILEMTKTGNTETAAGNLKFLVDSGLIANPERLEKVSEFLKNRAPGTGPSLPAPVSFEPSEALSDPLRQSLDKLMRDYVAALGKIGFPAVETARVKVESTPGVPNAYYLIEGRQMVIDPRIAGDRSVPLREFNHHILTARTAALPVGQFGRDGFAAIESGLADYLACSFLNNPRFGELAAKPLGVPKPFIRNMDNNRKFDGSASEPHDVGEIWSGALWAMRTELGHDVFDPIIVKAWLSIDWSRVKSDESLTFTTALVAAARQQTPERAAVVLDTFGKRGFPVPK